MSLKKVLQLLMLQNDFILVKLGGKRKISQYVSKVMNDLDRHKYQIRY